MIITTTFVLSSAFLFGCSFAGAPKNSSLRSSESTHSSLEAVTRRLAALEELVATQGALIEQQTNTIKNLHEDRQLQQACSPFYNEALRQCVYSDSVRFEGTASFLDPVVFLNDVIISGSRSDPTNFRVEGDVNTVFDQDRTMVVNTETIFTEDVFLGDDTRRPSRASRGSNNPSLYVDGQLVVEDESFFLDDVTIENNLLVEKDLEVRGNVEIEINP